MQINSRPGRARRATNLTLMHLGEGGSMDAAEVLAGLAGTPKRLSPKLFYDAQGSRLFNAICKTAAYYPTRTERAILTGQAGAIAAALGPDCTVLEFGPGEMSKIRLLLEALRPASYVGVDISRTQLAEAAEALALQYPWLEVVGICADFSAERIDALPLPESRRRVVFFPGSTIGNFEPDDARRFLSALARTVGSDGAVLIGVDFQKPPEILNLAYNDPQGLTRDFNLNLLTRLNRELGSDFDLRRFRHRAFYNQAMERVEMHLVSIVAQTVQVAGTAIAFAAGESIHTENSHKHTPAGFLRLAQAAGFAGHQLWTDARGWFGVFLLTAK
jgi:dimethylhistidine N-methyltransferase